MGIFFFLILLTTTYLVKSSYRVINSKNIILRPIKNSTVQEKLLVLVPGKKISIDEYKETCEQIQEISLTKLWITIIYCYNDYCNPRDDLNGYIKDDSGFQGENEDIFISGHGTLGGSGARYYIDVIEKTYAGLAFFGTQFNGDDDSLEEFPLGYPENLKSFKIPLLSLAGELDYIPISHLGLVYEQMVELGDEMFEKPAIVIQKMDNSGFCPDFHVKGDIVNELSKKESIVAVGNVTGDWIDYISFPDGSDRKKIAKENLNGWIKNTLPIVTPFLEARKYEFQWCDNAQKFLSGLTESQTDLLKIKVKFVNSTFDLDTFDTSYHLAKPNLEITDISRVRKDDGLTPLYTGAMDIACKAISHERVNQQLKLPVLSNGTCCQLNKNSFQIGFDLIVKNWPDAIGRFNRQGRDIQFLEDKNVVFAAEWAERSLGWEETSNLVEVEAIAFKQSLKAIFHPGVHFCKLLSPAKAVEWFMTTSLTIRYQ